MTNFKNELQRLYLAYQCELSHIADSIPEDWDDYDAAYDSAAVFFEEKAADLLYAAVASGEDFATLREIFAPYFNGCEDAMILKTMRKYNVDSLCGRGGRHFD